MNDRHAIPYHVLKGGVEGLIQSLLDKPTPLTEYYGQALRRVLEYAEKKLQTQTKDATCQDSSSTK